jgi:hypothetical protein
MSPSRPAGMRADRSLTGTDGHLTEKAVALRHDGMAPKAIARALDTSVADVVAALNNAVPTDSTILGGITNEYEVAA